MANFNKAYEIGRVNEGGYSNRKSDKGGETYAGVARNYWPRWEGWKIIDAYKKIAPIKQGKVFDNPELEGYIYSFYRMNFWNKILGDQIEDQQVANLIYDWSMTSGGAIREVQKVIGATPDGRFGPASLSRLNKAISSSGGKLIFNKIKEARRRYYISLNQPANIKGWINRVNSFNYTV